MKSLIGAILVGAALVLAGAATIGAASAAPQAVAQTAGTFDAEAPPRPAFLSPFRQPLLSPAPRYYSYYDRPYYYRPYPYSVPAPFTFGIGFGPVWW